MQHPILTSEAPTPGGFYSQAVSAGPFLFIAGQLPLDKNGNMVGCSPREQAAKTLQNVQAILKAANADFSNLVQVTIYITDIANWSEINEVYQDILQEVPVPPARAVVPVKELHYGALVEVQAVAYKPH